MKFYGVLHYKTPIIRNSNISIFYPNKEFIDIYLILDQKLENYLENMFQNY